MFDIFYIDNSTKLFDFEQYANCVSDACSLSRTRYLWIVNGLNDYSDFDFSWEPPPWEADQIHVWPSQHQQNSGTMLIPKFGATEKNYNHSIVKRVSSVPRLHIKHNPESPDEGDINTRYISNYLGTMRRVLKKVDWEYCWITADVCSYADFDFTWHPSEWQQDMLHVFPSNEQKFGDTFYVHVPSFLQKTEKLEVLELFDTLNFVDTIPVNRITIAVKYHNDTLINAVWNYKFTTPVVQFYKYNMAYSPTVSLWQEKLKTVVPLKKGGEACLIPRETKNYLKTQIYDYPYIDKTHRNKLPGNPIDIVFISNGESNAERNWEHLCNSTQDISNRVVRVDGVKGRAEAYRAAVNASETDWAFCVFAKLEVDPDFDWSWQPDRLQASKHYIFHAKNPVNGLVYGHMAMIAYNKRLTLANQAKGLDFTLDDEHEVVPVLSG